jgi:hypothetical protein
MDKHVGSKNIRWSTSVKKILLYGILVSVVFLLTIYGIACWDIRSGVKQICAEAMREYPGDRVGALIAYVKSEHHSLKDWNHAVWALGHIGDERALYTLRMYYTDQSCEHNKYLCQREIKKAIKLCEGEFSAAAWVCR